MGIVTALKLSPTMGAICVDQESWYLNRRRTFFSDLLYPLELPEFSKEFNINFVYGAVGNPGFHFEVMQQTRREIKEKWQSGAFQTVNMLVLSRIVLKAFQQVWHRRIDDQLQFFYGFNSDDLNRGFFLSQGKKVPIQNEKVRQYALDFVKQKEKLFFGTIPTPNHLCLIGVDPEEQFSAFCIKEEQGVLSFQSGGFESLGDGCYAGAMQISKELNQKFLASRRQGCGKVRGLLTLFSSILEASEHYCKIGGNARMMILDSSQPSFIREVRDATARLGLEITKAVRAQFLSLERAENLLDKLVFQECPWEEVEEAMFQQVTERVSFEKLLRGYKLEEPFSKLSPEHPLNRCKDVLKDNNS